MEKKVESKTNMGNRWKIFISMFLYTLWSMKKKIIVFSEIYLLMA